MTYVPGVDGKASVLKHDKATNVYGRRMTVIDVDAASDMVTYQEDTWPHEVRTKPRVHFLGDTGREDEANALMPWWNKYNEELNQ